jgi:integrase
LEKAFKAAGLTDVVFHTFRHTAASMAATGGASTMQIMDLMNHKTPAMAARYSHLNVTAREKLVDAVLAGVR